MEFIYFQSIVQYRIPIDDKGTAGRPEVLKTFTTTINNTARKQKTIPKELTAELGESVEM